MHIVLTEQEYEEFVGILEGPPRQCPKLVKLLTQPAPWEVEDAESVQDRSSSNTVQ